MKNNIQEILNEIYDIDPTLKGREEELIKALKKMLEVKPFSKIDEEFKNDLRQRLYVEAKYGNRKTFDLKNVIQVLTSFALGGTIAGLSVMFVLDSSNLNMNKQKSFEEDKIEENIMMMGVENLNENTNSRIFEDAKKENIIPKGILKSKINNDKKVELDEAPVEALIKTNNIQEKTLGGKNNLDEEKLSLDNFDFSENKNGSKMHIEQKDISGKLPPVYKYTFSGEFPDLKKEYKYYIITTLNRGITTVEEKTLDSKDEKAIRFNLDKQRMITSSVHPDSDRYEEIVYKDVEFTYIKKYKMKSQYLIPALWFKGTRAPIKGEGFKLNQYIELVDISK